jgi:glycosyltransferase involved in cell wall biosynthesis
MNISEVPLITTIIPTYQRPTLLKRAIYSVLNQTYPHLQVCIYDNASQDETGAVVKAIAAIDSRVKYHRHTENIGAVLNFQYGLSCVNTPFFSFLSDDDLLFPHFYMTAMSKFIRFPSAAFFLGSTIDVDDTGAVISANALHWKDEFFQPGMGVCELILNYFAWTGSVFRRDLLDVCPLDLSVNPVDLDFVARAAVCFPFVISKDPCALFITHSNSYSGSVGLKLIWPGWIKLTENVLNSLGDEYYLKSKISCAMRYKFKKILFSIAISLFYNKRFSEGWEAVEVYKKNVYSTGNIKILSAILMAVEKNIFIYYLFYLFVFVYRKLKRFNLNVKYRMVVSNLLNMLNKKVVTTERAEDTEKK